MADALVELPLFPLETVLFPAAAVQLHIFEDRYREMVRLCIENGTSFGIVLIRSGSPVGEVAEPYMIGTSVTIGQVFSYPDGRFDLQAVGERRFRIRRLDYSKPYLVGYVEPVMEAPVAQSIRADGLIFEAKNRFQTLIEGLLARPEMNVQVQFPPDPTELSFAIANLLQIDVREKQELLEMTNTLDRLERLMPHLAEHIEQIDDFHAAYNVLDNVHRVGSEDLKEWSGPN